VALPFKEIASISVYTAYRMNWKGLGRSYGPVGGWGDPRILTYKLQKATVVCSQENRCYEIKIKSGPPKYKDLGS